MIRLARPEDAPEIFNLGIQIPEINYSHVVPFMTVEEIGDAIASPDAYFAVATKAVGVRGPQEVSMQIVGFILVDHYGAPDDLWANITSLAVLPRFRRQGVFSALFDAWKVDAAARGVTYVCAYARAAHPIVEFLKKRNFVPGHDYTYIDQKFGDIK